MSTTRTKVWVIACTNPGPAYKGGHFPRAFHYKSEAREAAAKARANGCWGLTLHRGVTENRQGHTFVAEIGQALETL